MYSGLVGQDSIWQECIQQIDAPTHIFLTGAPGSGKTTLIRDFLQHYAREKGRPQSHLWGVESVDECLLLGPDQDRGIQTIRGQVSLFIRQMAIGQGVYRWVVIDDVDTFPQISQQALRRPMESYSHITRFLFIGTSEEDLIPALRSRCIHMTMNPVDTMLSKNEFLSFIHMPDKEQFTDEMWSWIIHIVGNNISDLYRLLCLVRDVARTTKKRLTIQQVRTLCSAPFYLDFIPLLRAMCANQIIEATKSLIHIWKRGYAYEDILESFQTIHQLFGSSHFMDNILIHTFLINAWISYCKGYTSILSLQHILYKTMYDHFKEKEKRADST